MNKYYKLGLEEGGSRMPVRLQHAISGSQDFLRGSRHLYRVGAETVEKQEEREGKGFFAGVIELLMNMLHVAVMIGGFLFIWRSIFV